MERVDQMPKQDYVVGLMSGTSLDGIDAALVEITDGHKPSVRNVGFISDSFSREIRQKILHLCDPSKARLEDISVMNMLLGEMFAEAATKVIRQSGMSHDDILLISSHGQTIYHQPDPIEIEERKITSTLQIGDIGVIAERTGILTVGDFRTRDMAAGGQGAPLVPYVDYVLFQEKEFGRVLLNIGGISNVTILPKNGKEEDVIAYDTGPGNMVIDMFTEWATDGAHTYDHNGRFAAKGKINETLLQELLEHPYFKQSPPKSTGRELFGREFAQKIWRDAESISNVDKIATITELTAITISNDIRRHQKSCDLQEVLVSGGGRFNRTLMDRMAHHLPVEINVRSSDEVGVPAEAKEAIAFALLGYQCYQKRTNNLPSATGAKNGVVMGKMAW